MANYDASIRVSTKADNSDLQKVEQSFKKIEQAADSANRKIKQQEGSWDSLSAKAEDYKTRLRDLEDKGFGFGDKKYDDLYIAWQNAEYAVKKYKDVLNDRTDQGLDRQASAVQKIREGFSVAEKSSKKCFKSIQDGTKKSNGLLSTFSSRLKGIALSLLVFNWITKGFNAMVSAMKEGFHNLAQYSDEYNQSMSALKSQTEQLKNSLATAFEPIVNMAIPYITKLVEWLNIAADSMAQFFAAIQGKSTYTRAKKQVIDYAKSLDTASKSAKRALASFDELNVLNKEGSVSSSGALTGADAFETAELSKEYSDFVTLMKQKMSELKDIFAKGFSDGLGDTTGRLNSIRTSVESIKDSFGDIFNADFAQGFNSAIGRIIKSVGKITGSATSIGLTIGTNLLGGISGYLEDEKGRIQQFLLDMFDIGASISEKAGELSAAFAYIFEEFASEDGQQLTENIIAIFSDAFMEISRLAGELGRDLMSLIVDPFVGSQEEFREALGDIIKGLKDFTGDIRTILNELFTLLSQLYEEYISPILEKMIPEIEALYKEHIAPLLSNLGEFFGEVGENLSALWNDLFKPFIQWFINNIMPVISPILEAAGKTFMRIFGTIADIISGFIDVLSGLISVLVGTFTGDWEQVWEGIKDILKGIANACISMFETFVNSAIDFLNGLIGGANNIAGAVGASSIPTIKEISLPRLANGAVIQGGKPFAAILGDQPAGQTNIETPLATMVDAFKQAMSETGGAGGSYTFVAQLEGRTIFSETVRQDQMQYKATGRSAFQH
ncbi:MAG: hypothetical protein J6Q61_00060 [Bacteroidales bacterium]|nr:hypothetical protein [Bacteroidales bacterium]